MMVVNCNCPRGHRYSGHLGTDLTVRRDLFAVAKTPKNVTTGVGWVFQNHPNPAFGQTPPDQAAVPDSSIGPFREADFLLGEVVDYSIGAAGLPESGE